MGAVLQPTNIRNSAPKVHFLHRIENVINCEQLLLRQPRERQGEQKKSCQKKPLPTVQLLSPEYVASIDYVARGVIFLITGVRQARISAATSVTAAKMPNALVKIAGSFPSKNRVVSPAI